MRSLERALTAVAFTTALVTGGVGAATTASAHITSGGGYCRALASVAGGVQLGPCSDGSIDGNSGWDTISASTNVANPNGLNIDVCFQALLVNPNGSTTQVHDYGCVGWNSFRGQYRTGQLGWVHPPAGTYVIQSGFWATINGRYGYYGAVQSPRITTDGANDY